MASAERNTWNSSSTPTVRSYPAAASASTWVRSTPRVQNGTGAPDGKRTSHRIQPVRSAHGSTRNVAGSGTSTTSPAPAKPATPTPVSAEKTGKIVLPEVSLSSSDEGAVTPERRAAGTASLVSVLPRSTPCWSAKENRTSSRPSSSMTRRTWPAAAYWRSLQSPCVAM
jgi:hypothetical protein